MNILFGKFKAKKESTKPTPMLRPTVSREIAELEERLETNCVVEDVKKLIGLYMKAIEFYEAEKNLKHIHFQHKLQELLNRPQVIQKFCPETTEKYITENVQEKVNPDAMRRSGNISPKDAPAPYSPANKPNLSIKTELVVKRSCENVIKQHSVRNSDLSKQLQDNLKSQHHGLTQRLFSRKQANTPKSALRFKFDEPHTGEVKIDPVEEFEKEVEDILETSIQGKLIGKKNIEEKYKEHIEEVELLNGEVKEKLAGELVKNMTKEIEELVVEVEAKRAEAILTARKKLHENSDKIF